MVNGASASEQRDRVYSWARRKGMHEPYDFAITCEELWGNDAFLVAAAKAWELKHLQARKDKLEEEIRELQSLIRIVDNDMERVEDETRWT